MLNPNSAIKNDKEIVCDHTRDQQEGKLKAHIDAVHNRLLDWKCPECDFMAAGKGNVLEHHRQVHRGIRRYTCNLCQVCS